MLSGEIMVFSLKKMEPLTPDKRAGDQDCGTGDTGLVEMSKWWLLLRAQDPEGKPCAAVCARAPL